MKREGFTLVEMLVILIFLSFIALMAVPNITSMIKKSEDDKYNIFLNDVFLATEAYIEKYKDDYPSLSMDGVNTYIYMKDLVDEGLISTNLVNPKYCVNNECTSKKIATCSSKTCSVDEYTIIVKKDEDGKYKYELKNEKIEPIEEHSVCQNASEEDYTITNIILNGSFENDFTNYYVKAENASISTTESLFGDKSYKRSNSTKAGGTCQYINVVEGHKYYYFIYFKSGDIVLKSDISNTGWGTISSSSSEWKKSGIIITATTTDRKNISLNYGNDITQDTYVDGVGLIDLTEAFGVGNEPSLEWCEANIDYFEGSKIICY